MSADNTPTEQHAHDHVGAYITSHTPDMLQRLAAWVAIPSIAADPERRSDLVRSARWLAGEMRDAGFTATIFETGDSHAVFGEFIVDPSAPTVLVYSHHDVRHAKPEQWKETKPFTPVVRDGRLYGRGASDAKGQALAHVWGARAHRATPDSARIPLNIKLLIEGEEEIGSPHLAELLDTQRERFTCDVIVFSDTVQWSVDVPAPVTSMRGILTATLTVTGPAKDVHSGVASGVTVNPALALATVLGRLQDPSGRIMLPNFYDDVAPLTPQRKEELEAIPYDDEDWLARTDTRVVVGEAGFTPKERLWARPAIEVISLLSGDTELSRSVIPAEASATLSIRIAANQRISTVAEQLRVFVAREMPRGAAYTLTVDEDLAQEAYTSPEGPVLDALEHALELGYGTSAPGRVGNAGGGPADLLTQKLGAPIYFLGTGLPEDNWHADDESINIRMLSQGTAAIAHLWNTLGGILSVETPSSDPEASVGLLPTD
ncbi:M20/M25/M40 family metallo-hydrolase [Microbacterium sp. W4I20]|uniref:M20/M25/M40 family metallo-hydrolase n=1 Tax=Microbacterium sp. W4I20 TaxID=3042262 RepID=UPI00278A0D89|nr:M20/M25/M40 family metallo-hydrolase [Microbacterium sp. W4I20]MDQ0729126.1 acetylornithine deacetylase/succinyl-diaminopimelate desuccinylase-like protein [Microbacterium sp. W4I20]